MDEMTENTDEQTVEETEESIELTDTADESDEEVSKESEEIEEEQPKGRFMTDEEINDLVDKRVSRKMKKFERENGKKLAQFKDTENILRKTLEIDDEEDVNQKLREMYKKQGVDLPEVYKPDLSPRQIKVLAEDEANSIIEAGYDAMVEEANRLADKKYENLDEGERIVFNKLSKELSYKKDKRRLKELGASDDLIADKDFIGFKNKFNYNTPIEDIYGLYKKLSPKKKFERPGSMKSNNSQSGVKDFYTPDEVAKLSPKDWEKPGVWETVMKSQEKWEK